MVSTPPPTGPTQPHSPGSTDGPRRISQIKQIIFDLQEGCYRNLLSLVTENKEYFLVGARVPFVTVGKLVVLNKEENIKAPQGELSDDLAREINTRYSQTLQRSSSAKRKPPSLTSFIEHLAVKKPDKRDSLENEVRSLIATKLNARITFSDNLKELSGQSCDLELSIVMPPSDITLHESLESALSTSIPVTIDNVGLEGASQIESSIIRTCGRSFIILPE